MNTRNQKALVVICAVAFVMLIFSAETAISAAIDGITICIHSIIPSLFPFILLSSFITTFLSTSSIPLLSSFCTLLGIPKGGESLFLLGLLAGYPVGAQNINSAYKNKTLSRQTAQRMLGFCSNAGPSFIFGILGPMFESKAAPWCLWAIHIVSAIIVGMIIPGKEDGTLRIVEKKSISLNQSMNIAIRAMASICGWVIIFRIIIAFLQNALLNLISPEISITVSGLLELSNGCLLLNQIPSEGTRFVLASLFLSLGGLCVAMQTISVTNEVGLGMYFPGKVLQASISVFLASLLQVILFTSDQVYPKWSIVSKFSLFLTFLIVLDTKLKNKCSFLNRIVV